MEIRRSIFSPTYGDWDIQFFAPLHVERCCKAQWGMEIPEYSDSGLTDLKQDSDRQEDSESIHSDIILNSLNLMEIYILVRFLTVTWMDFHQKKCSRSGCWQTQTIQRSTFIFKKIYYLSALPFRFLSLSFLKDGTSKIIMVIFYINLQKEKQFFLSLDFSLNFKFLTHYRNNEPTLLILYLTISSILLSTLVYLEYYCLVIYMHIYNLMVHLIFNSHTLSHI